MTNTDYDKIIASLFLDKYEQQPEVNEINFSWKEVKSKAVELYRNKEIKKS